MYQKLQKALQILLITCGIFVTLLTIWTLRKFANYSFQSLVATLYLPLGKGESFLPSLSKYVLIPTLLVIVCMTVITLKVKPSRLSKPMRIASILSVVCIAAVSFFWFQYLHIDEYLAFASRTSNIYEKYYKAPTSTSCTFNTNKRNLIHIYLESFEFEGDNFATPYFNEKNIPHLAKLARENYSLTSYNNSSMENINGTGYTTGALVGYTSGIASNISPRSLFKSRETFYKKATTIGEILDQQGYRTKFILGSDAVFGNRANYFKNSSIPYLDYFEMVRQGYIKPNYKVNWGVEDSRLFDISKKEITHMAKATPQEPFAVALLTVDTHTADGYTCSKCDMNIKDPYQRAIHCSDDRVAEFVDWVKKQPYYSNTTIIISGDHQSMDPSLDSYRGHKPLNHDIYYVVINPDPKLITPHTFKNRKGSSVDSFPTELASIGATIKGDHLGLGYNLFSNKKTLIESMGIKQLNEQLSMKSRYHEEKLF